jgi:hypothetical protein
MTGDPPPLPYVDMRSEPIFLRVLIKEALRRAFATIPQQRLDEAWAGEEGIESVHGEFGPATAWTGVFAPLVGNWLARPGCEADLREAIESLVRATQWEGDAAFADRMVSYLLNDLLSEIQEVVDNDHYTQQALSERLANAGLLPMFGFPTRVRLLYTGWPSPRPWPPEDNLVDRDLDIAISQFAPASQTVKDKRVHRACGVVELFPYGRELRSRAGFAPDLPNPSAPVGVCARCQAVDYLPPRNAPAPGGQEPPRVLCPVCGQNEMRVIDAREPKGFITDFRPNDFEGAFEWNARATRPTLSVRCTAPDVPVGNVSIASTTDEVLSINENNGQGGFDFQAGTVYNRQRDGLYVVNPPANSPVRATGQSYRIALLARRRTDVLLVDVRDWPDGIFADPQEAEGKAAWYSFAFFLRLAAAVQLDVDPTELDASFRVVERGQAPIGQAFLCDKLENGAGYCRWFGLPENFEHLLRQADPTHANNIAQRWIDRTPPAGPLISTPHGLECDTSCNRCLRDFHNLPYHGLLDWRLGLDLARVATTASSVVDLATPWGPIPNPWEHLLDGHDAPIPETMRRLGYPTRASFAGLTGFVHNSGQRVRILCHPLWTEAHQGYQAAKAAAEQAQTGATVTRLNPFRLLRRPADYV